MPDLLNVYKMIPQEVPPFDFIKPIRESLSLFRLRLLQVENLFDKYPDFAADNISKSLFRAKALKILNCSVLNPRLPIETMHILKYGDRRRTIAEPERLERQLSILFDIRKHLGASRKGCRSILDAPIRRRSFDHGEFKDQVEGIEEILGHEIDEPLRNHTVSDYLQAKLFLERKIRKLGWDLLQEEFDEMNDADHQKFASIYDKLKACDKKHHSSDPGIQLGRNTGEDVVIWQEHFSEEGYVYYYNVETGVSDWEQPFGQNVQILSQYQDSSGSWYWFNNITGATEWIQ